MIKRVEIFGLAKGKDSDEAWKYLSETHAPAIASRMPGLRKYIISRAVKPWIKQEGVIGGKPRWWCIAEQYFDSEEACEQAVSALANVPASSRKDEEIWAGYLGNRLGEAIVETEVLIKTEIPEKHVKRLGIFGLQEGKDSDEAWNYWVNIHAVHWKNTSPGCSLYLINRGSKTPWGKPKWWGLLEQRFDSIEALEKVMRLPRPSDDFMELYMCDLTGGLAYTEEKAIV